MNRTDPNGGTDGPDPKVKIATGNCMCSSYDSKGNPVTYVPEGFFESSSKSWVSIVMNWASELMNGSAQRAFGQGVLDFERDVISAKYWTNKASVLVSDLFAGVNPTEKFAMSLTNYVASIPDRSLSELSYDFGYSSIPLIGSALGPELVPSLNINVYGNLLRAPGGKVNGFSLSFKPGYGAKPRFDVHPMGGPSKKSNSMPKWSKGRTLPHWHRGKGKNLHRHRPWEKGWNDRSFLDRF